MALHLDLYDPNKLAPEWSCIDSVANFTKIYACISRGLEYFGTSVYVVIPSPLIQFWGSFAGTVVTPFGPHRGIESC